MSSGRVIGTVAFTRDPSDVEFNLVTEAEGCPLAYLHQQFQKIRARLRSNASAQDMLSIRQRTRAFLTCSAHTYHLQTTKQSAGLAQKDVIFEFPFLADDHAPLTFLEEPELDSGKVGHL